jgi:hypothetical protein
VAEDSPTNGEAQEETPARQDVDVLLDVSELEVDIYAPSSRTPWTPWRSTRRYSRP